MDGEHKKIAWPGGRKNKKNGSEPVGMNRWDALALLALLATMAYAGSIYYPEHMRAFASNDMVRLFSGIIVAAAALIFLLDYFLKIFSKAARQP